jgi:hypothetical protein
MATFTRRRDTKTPKTLYDVDKFYLVFEEGWTESISKDFQKSLNSALVHVVRENIENLSKDRDFCRSLLFNTHAFLNYSFTANNIDVSEFSISINLAFDKNCLFLSFAILPNSEYLNIVLATTQNTNNTNILFH